MEHPPPRPTTDLAVVIVAAGGVVLDGRPDGDHVLVIHRPEYDDWSLPKGHVDAGESLIDAAIREVAEETGITARPVREAGVTEHRLPGRPPQMMKRVHWFLMRTDRSGSPLRLPDAEVDRVEWWPVERAIEALTYPGDRALLRRAIADQGGTA